MASASMRAWCWISSPLHWPGATSQGVTQPSSELMGTCVEERAGTLMVGLGGVAGTWKRRQGATRAAKLRTSQTGCSAPAGRGGDEQPVVNSSTLPGAHTLSTGSLAARRRACSAGSEPHTIASWVAAPPVMCTQSVRGEYSSCCATATSAHRGREGGV